MTKLFSPAGHRWAGSDHGRWEPGIDRAALREEAIHADAELRVGEWLEDWEIVENHVRSGDLTITRGLAELIVAAARAPRGAHRDRTCIFSCNPGPGSVQPPCPVSSRTSWFAPVTRCASSRCTSPNKAKRCAHSSQTTRSRA